MALTLTQDTILHTHAGTRLTPPDAQQGDDLWVATLLPESLTVRVSPAVAFLIVAFMGGQSVESVLSDVSQCRVGNPESVINAINWLRDAGFLVDGSNERHQWAQHIMTKWAKYEWMATADYQIATFDFPFIDYSQPGSVEFDSQLMDHYESDEPDMNRTKRYEHFTLSIPAPKAEAVLGILDKPFSDAWAQFCTSQVPGFSTKDEVSSEDLLKILSITFGKLRTRTVLRNGQKRDLIRKTSPSGGSRHPTEAYIAVINVAGLEPGIYHFCVETNSFDRICDLPPAAELELIFEGPFRTRQEVGAEPAAVVIMTSVFERVMWRYREPRTFRTLFMDVGHLTTTLQFAASAYGYSCYSQHGLIDEEIERLIGVDRFTEGVIYGAAIGIPGTFGKQGSGEAE